MCWSNWWPDYWPPPTFEYVDLWQYSDNEIHNYIKVLCEFMNNRKEQIQELKENPKTDQELIDEIPF